MTRKHKTYVKRKQYGSIHSNTVEENGKSDTKKIKTNAKNVSLKTPKDDKSI